MSAAKVAHSSISILPTQDASALSDTSILKEGSSIFVRVLSAGKGGQYTVSFAGNRFEVFSQRTLEAGSAFRALISIKDGKVFLSPESLYGKAQADSAVQRFSSFSSDTSGRLSAFLQQMGLPIDSISLRLVQFFQEAQVKFNFRLAEKARAIGLRFPGREEEAAEAALFLEQKGINADMDTVMELLDVLYGGKEKENQNKNHANDTETPEDDIISTHESATQVSHYPTEKPPPPIKNANFLDNLYENSIAVLNGETGLLTLINHYHSNPLHWLILPFDYQENEKTIYGVIKILLDINKKITKKMIISAYLCSTTYVFLIEYTGNIKSTNKKSWTIGYCSQPKKQTEQIEALLKSFLPESMDFSVQYRKELAESVFFTLGAEIPLVKVDA